MNMKLINSIFKSAILIGTFVLSSFLGTQVVLAQVCEEGVTPCFIDADCQDPAFLPDTPCPDCFTCSAQVGGEAPGVCEAATDCIGISYCGDGHYSPDLGEQCDDGNFENGDGCSSDCELEDVNSCGDGDVDPGETCDHGGMPDEICDVNCQLGFLEFCGDGSYDPPAEQCDDGNNNDGDGCSATCQLENPDGCGNGILDLGETCDDGPGGVCDDVTCQLPLLELCGDGMINGPAEQCDDGNNVDDDGCSHICQLENPELCGNGILDAGETCDDGNNINNDGCSAFCQNFGLDAQILPLTGVCVQGSGNAPGNLDTNCAGCSLNPFASSKGFWENYGAFLAMLSAAALAWMIRRRLRATNA